MAAAALKSIVVPAKKAHSATVIFSHGLGDTGHGALAGPILEQNDNFLADEGYLPYRLVLPG